MTPQNMLDNSTLNGFRAQWKKQLFPNGMERVSLGDFHSAPPDGLVFRQENDKTISLGLHSGDVIVAIDGIRCRIWPR